MWSRPFGNSWFCYALMFTLICGLQIKNTCTAQYYKPFTATTKKLFTTYPIPSIGYSMAFDSAEAVGTDSLYHHFGALNDSSTVVDSACIAWCSTVCRKTDHPIWSGSLFMSNNNGRYFFSNLHGDSLTFDLTISIGDTSLFFEDTSQRFFIVHEGSDTTSILGFTDSIASFRILHTDLIGQPIASPLDQEYIKIGKQLGLVQFFQIDQFPTVLKPLVLIGQEGQDLGLFQITNDHVYDHDVGDVIQTKYDWYTTSGPPPNSGLSYRRIEILGRTDTQDSIIYNTSWQVSSLIPTMHTSGMGQMAYYKHQLLAEIPFERYANAQYHSFRSENFCGTQLWAYSTSTGGSTGYCPDGKCWVCIDTNGPPPTGTITMVLGVGLHDHLNQLVSPAPLGFSYSTEIIYFEKNGVACGTEIPMALDQQELDGHSVEVFPNPAKTELIVRSTDHVGSIQLLGATGKVFQALFECGERTKVALDKYGSGLYIVRVELANGAIVHRTISVVK